MCAMFHPGGAYRTLWSWEKDDYLEHLKRLGPECRRLRFHRAMSDDGLALHVDQVFKAERDGGVHVIGWFHDGDLAGAAEVAVYETPSGLDAEAAFAVEEGYRGAGVGRELMHRAALYAQNRGAATLHIATERENRAMLRMAVNSGATFEITASEADGVLQSEPRTIFSILLETVEEEAGVAFWAWDRFVAWTGRKWDGLLGRPQARRNDSAPAPQAANGR